MNQTNLPAVVQAAITEQRVDLSKVNLMLPTQTFGEVLGMYDRVTIEVVTIDTARDAGEVFDIGGKKSLGRVPLEKIASAVGIIWDPANTTVIESSSTKSRAKATGALRKPNGEWVILSEEKTVDLEAFADEQRIALEEKAAKGNPDGKVTEWGESRGGKKYPARFEPWKNEAEEAAWLELALRKAMLQYRKFKDERAVTGAKERCIRALLALKSSYTEEELSRPLAFPRVLPDVNKMLADPQVRQAAIERMTGAAGAIFGPGNGGRHERDVSPAHPASAQDAGLEIPASEVHEPPADDFQDDIPWDEKPEDVARRGLRNFLDIPQLHPQAREMIETMLAEKDATLEAMTNLIERTNVWLDKARIPRPVPAAKGGAA